MNNTLNSWLKNVNPFTNVYGLGRSFIVLGSIIALLFNDVNNLFKPTSEIATYPQCGVSYSIFCLAEFNDTQLNILRWVCIIVLLVIASGWRPRVTGIIHAWITFSIYHSASTVDGGEQVAVVFSLILLPLTLMDKRKWHWQDPPTKVSDTSKLVGITTYYAFRLQVAILYFHSVVAKIGQENWIDGTAVWYYMQSPMLGMNELLFNFFKPVLGSWLIILPTWGTLILQTVLVLALFLDKKYWKYVFFAAIFMHEIFAVLLGLISFSTIMVGVLLIYLWPLDSVFKFKGVKKVLKREQMSIELN